MLHHVRIFILGCVCVCSSAQNEYGDYGIVFTGLPAEIDEEYQNIISVPNMPIDIENTTEHYPGFNFGFLFRRPISCAVDYSKNELYVYDYHLRGLLLIENFNSSAIKSTLNITRQHYGISREYVKLAFDWISHNIYWTDPLMGWIAMQPGGAINDPSQYKVIVSEHLQLPRGIAVDPINGYLFWTDFNVIERSSLTGENRQKIIFKQLTDPTAIVADHVSKRIYWTDIQFIDSATYDGTQRTHVVRENNVRYFDVALFEDILIVTDIHNYFAGEIPYSAKFYNKTTGQELKDKRLNTTREAYFGVCLYTERVQPPQPDLDHCENANCQDICVNEPSGAKCLCREGFQLQGDNRRCQEIGGKHQRAIIVNTGRDLCLLDIRVLSDHHNFSPECFYNGTDGETISYFDVDMISRTVYFSILNKLYSVKIDKGIDGRYAENITLTEQSHDITGMSYDYIHGFLYYGVASSPQALWLYDTSLDGDYYSHDIPTGSLDSFTVVPHTGNGFWISNETTLQMMYLLTEDNPANTDIVNITIDIPLTKPKHMVHDVKYELLYALIEGYDGHTDLMGIEYNGSVSHYVATDRPITDFAIYKEYVVLVNKDNDGKYQIQTGDLGLGMPLQIVNEGVIKTLSEIKGIKMLDETMQVHYPNPCGSSTNNGGCEGICLPDGNKPICKCNIGYTLHSDGKQCISNPIKDEFILVSDVTYNKIFQVPLNNPSQVIAIRTPDIGRPDGVMFNYLTNELYWSNSFQAQLWAVNLNGTREHLLGDIGSLLAYPDRIALDPSSGNIYYTAISYHALYDVPEYYYSSYIGVINKEGKTTVVVWEGHRPRDIVLDPAAGYMFWTDHGSSSPGIFRANMDGTDKVDLHVTDVVWPNGLAIDTVDKMIYWVDGYLDRIYKSGYGGDFREIFLEVEKGLQMTDIDLVGQYLYYTALKKNTITRVNKNNKNDIKQLGPDVGLGVLYALDVYDSTASTNIPVHTNCSQNNGGCSHFCFPTTDGYSCGCEYYFDLLADGMTCENANLCPLYIPNGMLIKDDLCVGGVGNRCDYICDEGYKPRTQTTYLTCTSELDMDIEGQLKWDMPDPCEEIRCPQTNGNVIIDKNCKRTPGETCRYKCPVGHKPSTDNTGLMCHMDGRWNISTSNTKMCTKIRCPATIEGGSILPPCSMLPGTVCSVTCNEDFKLTSPSIHLMCTNNGTWNTTNNLLAPCIAKPGITVTQTDNDDNVAIGVGIGVSLLVLMIIVAIVMVICIRTGKISSPFKKQSAETNPTTFENPRYIGNNVQLGGTGTEANASFGYSTLHEDRVSSTNAFPKSSTRSSNSQHTNRFS